MKKFVCPVCGYVHEGESAPEKCPMNLLPGTPHTGHFSGALQIGRAHV